MIIMRLIQKKRREKTAPLWEAALPAPDDKFSGVDEMQNRYYN